MGGAARTWMQSAKFELLYTVSYMLVSSKPNGVTRSREIADPKSNDEHGLRVMNCATTTAWRGSEIAGMRPPKAAVRCRGGGRGRDPLCRLRYGLGGLTTTALMWMCCSREPRRVNPFPEPTTNASFFFAFAAPPTLITWPLSGLSVGESPHQINLEHRSFSGALGPVHDRVSFPCAL